MDSLYRCLHDHSVPIHPSPRSSVYQPGIFSRIPLAGRVSTSRARRTRRIGGDGGLDPQVPWSRPGSPVVGGNPGRWPFRRWAPLGVALICLVIILVTVLLVRRKASPDAVLQLSIQGNQHILYPGEVVTYTIILGVRGDVAAHGVSVRVTLPTTAAYLLGSTTRNQSSVADRQGLSALQQGLVLATVAPGHAEQLALKALIVPSAATGEEILVAAAARQADTSPVIAVSAAPLAPPPATPSWTATITPTASRTATALATPTPRRPTPLPTRPTRPSSSSMSAAAAQSLARRAALELARVLHDLPVPTDTPTPTLTGTPTSTLTATSTPTDTATTTPSVTVTATRTPPPTRTPIRTATPRPSSTSRPTNVPSPTPRPTSTRRPTPTPTATRTPQPTQTPTATRTPRPTQTPTATRTPRPTSTRTATRTPRPTHTPTASRTATPTATSTRTPTATVRPSDTRTPTATRTARPTRTATPNLALLPTVTPGP